MPYTYNEFIKRAAELRNLNHLYPVLGPRISLLLENLPASSQSDLPTLGTSLQQLRVNSGGTALEYFTPSGGGGAGDIINGGNTTGNPVIIGTNDTQELRFETDNITRVRIGTNTFDGIGLKGVPVIGWRIASYSEGVVNPNILIGPANGIIGSISFQDNTGTAYSNISADSGLTYIPSSIYNRHTFYTEGQIIMQLISNAGVRDMPINARISSSTIQTAGSNVGAFNIDRTFVEQVSGPNQHGYVDKTIFRFGGNAAFNAFYAENTIGTTNPGFTQDHWSGFQSRITKDGLNTVTHLYDFVALGALINGGTATNRYGFRMFTANNAGGGTLTNQYGVYIDPLSGATNNYGAYFGNKVGIGTPTPKALLAVVGLLNFANNAAAISGGLVTGDFYFTDVAGEATLKIVL